MQTQRPHVMCWRTKHKTDPVGVCSGETSPPLFRSIWDHAQTSQVTRLNTRAPHSYPQFDHTTAHLFAVRHRRVFHTHTCRPDTSMRRDTWRQGLVQCERNIGNLLSIRITKETLRSLGSVLQMGVTVHLTGSNGSDKRAPSPPVDFRGQRFHCVLHGRVEPRFPGLLCERHGCAQRVVVSKREHRPCAGGSERQKMRPRPKQRPAEKRPP